VRTFWGALLDPSERPWALPVFLGFWTLFALLAIFAGADPSLF